MKKSRKESELNTVDSQIKGLEMRLKYGKTDKDNTVIIKLFFVNILNILDLKKLYFICFYSSNKSET